MKANTLLCIFDESSLIIWALKKDLYKDNLTITLKTKQPIEVCQMKDEQIDSMSKILKSMSHPIRLKILCLLQDKELSVGDIRDQVETTNANVSQHLNILRSQGIIDYRKDANFIYNRITDKRILELIHTMRNLFCPNFD
jgi:ArsR family transcriptional regulator